MFVKVQMMFRPLQHHRASLHDEIFEKQIGDYPSETALCSRGRCGAMQADGKMQFWCSASMFFGRCLLFKQRFYIQRNLSGLFEMDKTMELSQLMPIVGEVLVLAPAHKLFLSSRLFIYIVFGSVGTDFGHTL